MLNNSLQCLFVHPISPFDDALFLFLFLSFPPFFCPSCCQQHTCLFCASKGQLCNHHSTLKRNNLPFKIFTSQSYIPATSSALYKSSAVYTHTHTHVHIQIYSRNKQTLILTMTTTELHMVSVAWQILQVMMLSATLCAARERYH